MRKSFLCLALAVFVLSGVLFCACPVRAAGITMLESVETALTYNPQLKVSQEKRQVSLHAIDKARAGFFPSITAEAGGGFSQRDDTERRAYSEERKVRAQGDAGLRLVQPIWQGGYTTADVAARRAQYDSVDSQLEDSATDLAFQAIMAHVEVMRWREMVQLAKNNIKEHTNILNTVRKRAAEQISTVGELHQVEGRYSRARATLLSYEAALAAAQAAYLNATGTEAKNLMAVPNPPKTFASQDAVLEACLNGNTRVKAAMSEVEAASGEKEMARSSFFPSVNLEAGPSWWNRESSHNSRISEVNVGVRLKWDLLNGGADVANMAMARARIRQAKQNLHSIMDALGKDIETTYSYYLSAKEQIPLYEAAKKSSRLAKEDYYRQFLSAQRSLLDVLDIENDYFFAAGQQTMSQGDRVIAGYRLLALSGELLVSLGVNPASLRLTSPTTTESTGNLRGAFPSSLRGKAHK